MVSTLLLVIILQVAIPPPPLRVLEVRINDIKDINIHITESKIHISYSENHDSTLCFYYFYMSALPTLAHTFSISSPFDVTKLQQQKNCLDVSSTGSFPFPISMDAHIHIPYHRYGNGDSTWHRGSHYSSQCSRKLWFRHYYQ